MTKKEIYTNVVADVTNLLNDSKTSKAFQTSLLSILETNLAPKSGGSITNPPILNEDGTIKELWCRFHKCYEPLVNMVMASGKSKGYCRASISLWNKTNSLIKKLDSEASDFMSEGDFDNAQRVAKESKKLKSTYNTPEFFDYDRDWASFNTPKTK